MLFAWQRRVAGASSQAVRKHSENEKNIDIKNLSSLKHIYNDSFLHNIDANNVSEFWMILLIFTCAIVVAERC